jgi:hypothetical protein
MWVLLNHVKADKRDVFERFMGEIIMPTAERFEPNVTRRVRILHPTTPNEDGTYTYIFLMDPVVADGEYEFERILERFYPPEQVAAYLRMWEEAMAVPQISYAVVQSAQ